MNEGVGVAYRPEFESYLTELSSWVDAFEIISENYLNDIESEELDILLKLKPLLAHSVSLSIGSTTLPKDKKLDKFNKLIKKCNLDSISDHLSFSEIEDIQINNFINLPFTEEMLDIVCQNIQYVQNKTEKKFLFENIVYFLSWPQNDYSEIEFISKLVKKADCGILLDISNLYINSENNKYCPYNFIDHLPKDFVGYYHVSGFDKEGDILVDSHDKNVDPEVWKLVEYSLRKTSGNVLIIERDNNSTNKEELHSEISIAKDIWNKTKNYKVMSKL
ncbi:MbnB/TglH/ChrH family RiPP precursor modification enzyme [Bacillus chungangensis]|uniref:Uncharacterized protein (UPF0276 family) n=1 Tax=Bacillus chungangensis TaxID=587633 RepID=A0ABT9WSH0_9BACI|nr:DUF692 domain-containing protein [Bacillus chungangensis]MDQ0176245.1 uncharacterized protein (UPF0276 family) [Bacillus chungangensis]